MIDSSDVQDLVKIYENAENSIIEEIKNTQDVLKIANKNKMLKQIQNILTDLYTPTSDFITSKSKKEYQSGIQEVQEALGKVDLKGTFQLVNPNASKFVMLSIQEIQDGALADVKLTLSNSFLNIQNTLNLVTRNVKNNLASDTANGLVNKIAQGQILGNPRKEISKQLAAIIKDRGITSFTYATKNGERNLSLTAYAEGLTRSTLINSRASAVVQQCLEMGHDLIKVDHHANESRMCAKWSGQIFSISGNTTGYTKLSDALFSGDYKKGGLLHRYCRHSFTVYIPTKIKFN